VKNYIEYRIELKHDADFMDVAEAADHLQNLIVDLLSPEVGAPKIFTQDVTYEIKYGVTKDEIQ
jgi:hypothetical protein